MTADTNEMTVKEIDAFQCQLIDDWVVDDDSAKALQQICDMARLAATEIPKLRVVAQLNKIHVERIAELEAENERLRKIGAERPRHEL